MPAPPGLDDLINQCPFMEKAYTEAGAPLPRDREDGFPTLLRIIIDQQVSVQAGRAIWNKVSATLGDVTPETVALASDAALKSAGLSRGKTRYAKELANAIISGQLDLIALRQKDDADVMAVLTQIKGIGRWTAEIYLMFALGRPDVMPSGDLAVAEAASRLMGLDNRPTPKELDAIADAWRPWRTTAALMLWHYYAFGGRAGGPIAT